MSLKFTPSPSKVDDFWEPAKKQLLADAKGFMDSLVKFDKDNIPDRIIKKVRGYRRVLRNRIIIPGLTALAGQLTPVYLSATFLPFMGASCLSWH